MNTEWKPIESAPKDELILVGPTKRMGICVAMNHSRDGWVTETCNEWCSIYTPTHWMPLPAEPCLTCNGHGMIGGLTPHPGYDAEPCPDCSPAPTSHPIPTGATGEDGEALRWRDGEPPFPQNQEWFIAETTYGDRVVLCALPKGMSHDYKTADETYLRANLVKRWMQFPDCEYLPPEAPAAGDALDAARYRWLRDNILEDHSLPGSFWLSDTGGESWDKTIDAAMDYQRQGDAA